MLVLFTTTHIYFSSESPARDSEAHHVPIHNYIYLLTFAAESEARLYVEVNCLYFGITKYWFPMSDLYSTIVCPNSS